MKMITDYSIYEKCIFNYINVYSPSTSKIFRISKIFTIADLVGFLISIAALRFIRYF